MNAKVKQLLRDEKFFILQNYSAYISIVIPSFVLRQDGYELSY